MRMFGRKKGNAQGKENNDCNKRALAVNVPASNIDTSFMLISPASDLSNPSNFPWKAGQPPSNIPTPLLQRHASRVIIHNIPPQPVNLARNYKPSERPPNDPKFAPERPLLNKKKGAKKVKKVTTLMRGCLEGSAARADKMICAQLCVKSIEDQNLKERMSIDAVVGANETHHKVSTSDGGRIRKSKKSDTAGDLRRKEGDDFVHPLAKADSFEPLWLQPTPEVKEQRFETDAETATPLAMLDGAFAATTTLHEEDAYFNRLSVGHVLSPSVPLKEASPTPEHIASDGPPVEQPSHETVPSSKEGVVVQKAPTKENIRPVVETVRSPVKEGASIFRPRSATKQAKQSERQHGKGGDLKTAPRPASIRDLRLTGSDPGVPKTKDYRNIALTKSDDGPKTEMALVASNRHLALSSPSANSISSNGSIHQSPGAPLLSNQCLSNAAFLFSPSYAGDDAQMIHRPVHTRSDPNFSISTFAARARLPNITSGHQQPITIPVSKSWESNSDQTRASDFMSAKEYSEESVAGRSQKQVRFSDIDDHEQPRLEGGKRNTRTVSFAQKTNVPEDIATTIESKLSDLTDITGYAQHNVMNMMPTMELSESHRKTQTLELGRLSMESSPGSVYSDDTEPTVVRDASSMDSTLPESPSNAVNQSIHWEYCEVDGKICATPAKRAGKKGLPTKSPALRFRAAQTKFSVQPEPPTVPSKIAPPKVFSNRTPKKTLVSNRINDINNRLSEPSETDATVLQQPQHVGKFFAKGGSVGTSHTQEKHSEDIPSDEETEADEESTVIQQAQREDNQLKPRSWAERNHRKSIASYNEADLNNIFSPPKQRLSIISCSSKKEKIPSTKGQQERVLVVSLSGDESMASEDCSEIDLFQKLMMSNTEDNSSLSTARSSVRRHLSLGTTSVSTSASNSVRLQHTSSFQTFDSDKENSLRGPSLNSLHRKTHLGQVKTTGLKTTPGSLFLSPTQRTPMQARKWRTLAAAAEEKEKQKKKNKGKMSAFRDRSTNVQ